MDTIQLLTDLADSGKLDWNDALLVRRAAKELTESQDIIKSKTDERDDLSCSVCGSSSLAVL